MGQTITPRFALRVSLASGRRVTPIAWNVREDGPATDAGLARWVEQFEASTGPNGANAHLGQERVLSARIVRNDDFGQVVATFRRLFVEI